MHGVKRVLIPASVLVIILSGGGRCIACVSWHLYFGAYMYTDVSSIFIGCAQTRRTRDAIAKIVGYIAIHDPKACPSSSRSVLKIRWSGWRVIWSGMIRKRLELPDPRNRLLCAVLVDLKIQ